MKGLRRTFPFDLAGLTVALSAIAVIYGGIRAFYFQVGFLESFSYYSDERPFNAIVNGWLGRDPTETLVGIHAFGDYVLLNVWAQFPDPWGQLGVEQVNYLPPVLLFYKVIGLLPYAAGLTLFLIALAVCMVLPMVIATRGWPITQRLLIVTTLAVLTGPTLATLDRANNQGFLPILLFGFGVTVVKQRWGWASVFLALAATIKIYPIVLIVLLIALRRFRWAVASLGIVAAGILLSLPFTTTAGLSGLTSVVGDVLQYPERSVSGFLEYNTSFAGGLANLFMLLGMDTIGSWVATNAIVVIAVYAALVLPLLWLARVPLWLRVILVLSLTTALMPSTYPYALNWVLAASAIAVWVAGKESREVLSRNVTLSLATALAAITAVLPVLIPGSAEAGRAAGAASLASLAAALVIPITVLASFSSRSGSHRTDSSARPSPESTTQ